LALHADVPLAGAAYPRSLLTRTLLSGPLAVPLAASVALFTVDR
jgi:hypothetical protein